jgi:hypothetical protein
MPGSNGVRQVILLCLLAHEGVTAYLKVKNTKKYGSVVDMLWMWSCLMSCMVRPLLLPLQGHDEMHADCCYPVLPSAHAGHSRVWLQPAWESRTPQWVRDRTFDVCQ